MLEDLCMCMCMCMRPKIASRLLEANITCESREHVNSMSFMNAGNRTWGAHKHCVHSIGQDAGMTVLATRLYLRAYLLPTWSRQRYTRSCCSEQAPCRSVSARTRPPRECERLFVYIGTHVSKRGLKRSSQDTCPRKHHDRIQAALPCTRTWDSHPGIAHGASRQNPNRPQAISSTLILTGSQLRASWCEN